MLTAVFSLFVTMVVMKRLFQYRYRYQLWDLTPPLLLSGVMAAAVLAVAMIPMGNLPSLIVQIVAVLRFTWVWRIIYCSIRVSVALYLDYGQKGQKPESGADEKVPA